MIERTTSRLVVRPLRRSDYQRWKETLLSLHPSKNPWDEGEVHAGNCRQMDFKKLLQAEKSHKPSTHYSFGVFMKKSGKFVGSTALMDISRGVFHNAYLGYWMANTCWGLGYGTEAVLATIDIAFRDLGLHRVEAGIAPKNARSLRLARSLKMRREGKSARRLYLRGQWRDMVIYALTSEEFGIECKPALRK